jgi:hypothetical protein
VEEALRREQVATGHVAAARSRLAVAEPASHA